jgi:hypothetical protein
MALDFVRGQGVGRFESGAYTIVREHFETTHNAAIRTKDEALKAGLWEGGAPIIPSFNIL